MTFAPGQSGNPSGKPKSAKLIRDALMAAAKRVDADGIEALQRAADAVMAAAIAGDVQAFREVADRIDGKVPQAVVGDEEGPPMKLVVSWQRTAEPSTS